jgi:hypothetical protein
MATNANTDKPERIVKSIDELSTNPPLSPSGSSIDPRDIKRIQRLGDKISALALEIDTLDYERSELLKQLNDLRSSLGIDFSVKGDKWTYEECSGRTHLDEKLLLENGVSARIIKKCKRKGKGYLQVRRDREKKV